MSGVTVLPVPGLPVLQSWLDDGFIELRDLPLQHGPQVLPQPVVVLLQLLLVLLLVRSDQVLVLLHGLPTPAGIGQSTGGRQVAGRMRIAWIVWTPIDTLGGGKKNTI